MKNIQKYPIMMKIFLIALFLRNIRRLYSPAPSYIRNSLLLIAHPDDESMFFSPFLFYNTPNVILCLSSGDYNNSLGHVRSNELKSLCTKRGWDLVISRHKDGSDWNINSIVVDVLDTCKKYNIESIITFDEKGVSGHKNHISCYKAIRKIKDRLSSNYFTFYCLKTVNIFEKYIFSIKKSTYQIPLVSLYGVANMMYHRSQLVWFRFIYLLFSSYMYFNEIIKIY